MGLMEGGSRHVNAGKGPQAPRLPQRTVGSMERTAGGGRFVQDVSLPVTSLKGVQ